MLSKLLQAKVPLFDLAIKQLEDYTHQQGVDTRLIAEILRRAHSRMEMLGLDSGDTTPMELYYALLNRLKQDNERLATILNIKDPDSAEIIPDLIEYVRKLDIAKDSWVIKEEVARMFLMQTPPKNLMKRLGYKKPEQMLDKEDLFEVYGALRFAESAEWLNKFNGYYHTLTADDFEPRQIRLIHYDMAKWGDIAHDFIEKKLHNITHLKELGIVVALPIKTGSDMLGRGVALKILSLLIHYVYEIRLYSAFFKLMQSKKNFGEIVADTLIADTANVDLLKGEFVNWRVIQRYYGRPSLHEQHPEVFEPHVHPEDLHYRKTEDVLFSIDPELEFWKDMDYVGIIMQDETITFNLIDNAFCYANEVEFNERYLYHFREALWNEVFMRYMGQANLEERILLRLDNELIKPQEIPLNKRKR